MAQLPDFHRKLIERCRITGFGPSALNFAADIIEMAGAEAKRWSHRMDDAQRLPDFLQYEVADALRAAAKEPIT